MGQSNDVEENSTIILILLLRHCERKLYLTWVLEPWNLFVQDVSPCGEKIG